LSSTPDNSRRLRWPALWLALSVLACSINVPAATQNEEQLRALRARIEALQADLNETRSERDEARTQLGESERRMGSQYKSLRDTEARQKSESARLAVLQQARTRNRAELDTRRQELEQSMRAAYLLGKQDYLKLLLSQDDPARVSRTLTYYRYLVQARATRIEGLETTLNRLDVVEKQIAERVQELAALRTRQLEQKTALEATRAERRRLLAQLNERVRDRSQEIERLKRDQDRVTRLVHELRGALERAPAPDLAAGHTSINNTGRRWHLPIQGRLIARFGSPKEVGDLRWRGIFLAAPEGQTVRAVARGRVAYADWLRGFGLLVVLDHGGGLMTLYGHNQSLYKGVGDSVEAEEAIAASGNTGGPAQSGLYFEVREHGEPRNPLDWCKL
jgi:septal ring factor EnvC (AmiA/AmiB activator)